MKYFATSYSRRGVPRGTEVGNFIVAGTRWMIWGLVGGHVTICGAWRSNHTNVMAAMTMIVVLERCSS